MEKAVIGATKPKCMYPKQKYLDTILYGANTSMHNIMLILEALQPRLSNATWTVSFKALLVVHLMMRSNVGSDVLSYCASQKGILSAAYKGGAHSGHSATIHAYARYLNEKIYVYGEIKTDPVRSTVVGREGYLRTLTVQKGLLHHVGTMQKQVAALLDCKFYIDELSNEVTIGAFALLVQDLLRLFQAMNEGVINILQHFFEMTKDQATAGLKIYKIFADQTSQVVEYFSVAKRMEGVLHFSIPELKHAPLSLVKTLEEYLKDFDANQQERARAREAAKSAKSAKSTSPPSNNSHNPNNAHKNQDNDIWTPKPTSSPASSEPNQPNVNKDIIDFFSSIDNETTNIQQHPNTFQAQNIAGGDAFQEFQQQMMQMQQLQQMQQLEQMQQMQLLQQQQMLQAQMTGFPSAGGISAQPTGFGGGGTNPFLSMQAQPTGNMLNNNPMMAGSSSTLNGLDVTNFGGVSTSNSSNGINASVGGGLLGSNSMNFGSSNSLIPQPTGNMTAVSVGSNNPFRAGGALGSSTSTSNATSSSLSSSFGTNTATSLAPSVPLMTGPAHFQTMPSLSSQPTGSRNPFAPSSNPLNPFSPNYGQVSSQPTGMGMGHGNSNTTNW